MIKLLDKPSHYRKNGNLEGIYIRIDGDKYLENRCKIVREDFIQQIKEHWSAKDLKKNIIDYESVYDQENYS